MSLDIGITKAAFNILKTALDCSDNYAMVSVLTGDEEGSAKTNLEGYCKSDGYVLLHRYMGYWFFTDIKGVELYRSTSDESVRSMITAFFGLKTK